MADPGSIQRVPAGLLNVLGMQSAGSTPPELAQLVSGVIDLLQFYGLTQRQVLSATQVAVGPLTDLNLELTPPTAWGILFNANANAGIVAGMTGMQIVLGLQRGATGVFAAVASKIYLNAAGDLDDSGLWAIFNPAYPLLLPPSSTLRVHLGGVAGVAGADIGVVGEIGLLG